MKLRLAAACAVMSFACATSALADQRITATLETPQAAASKIIVAHAVWNCAESSCVAGFAPDDIGGVAGCREVVKKLGRLTAYSTEYRALDAAALAKCNAAAPQTATASR